MKASEFPERFKKLLEQHELSQTEFAKLGGFNPSYISHLCNGTRYPSYENLIRIMDVFGDPYSKSYLVGA
jgi:transcriptional regulator with XRE-family HTH domain